MVSKNQTRFNQSIFVNGDIEVSGNINAPFGNIFAGSGVSDSITKCNATFLLSSGNKSRTLQNVEFIDKFEIGQKIRIYGASSLGTNQIDNITTTLTVSATPPNETVATNIFYYKISEFNLKTGEISPASLEKSVNVQFALDKFGVDQFITLTFGNILIDRGILLYRKINETQYRLVSVLGPKDLETNIYIDYYLFDYTDWSGKVESNNTLPNDIIHFSHTPPTTPRLGWVDATIDTLDIDNSSIVISTEVKVDPGYLTINISHNDTDQLQSQIDTSNTAGKNNLNLLDKIYIVSGLDLPNNFNITGSSNSSGLKKLPWSGGYFTQYNNNIVYSSSTTAKYTLSNVVIDGNMTNQFLVDDSSNNSKNYAINFGVGSTDCKIYNSKIYNVAAGGIYAPESDNFQMFISELKNSGLTDRYDFKPLDLAESSNVSITSNRIENFSDYIDLSIVYKGVISNNLIQNCGTGIFAYGSRFFISSPNVLMGPANEFLPSPDIFNTTYNSVNIRLPSGGDYTSDVYTYQENGEIFDLTTSNQTVSSKRGNVQYEIWKLSKNNVGVETLYEKIADTDVAVKQLYDTDVAPVNQTLGVDPTNGEFKFKILSAGVTKLKTTYSYDTLRELNSNHIGVVYIAYLEEWINAGNISGTGTIVSNNTYSFSVINAQYLYVGAKISLSPQHQGFDVSGSNDIGTITSLSTVTSSGVTTTTVTATFANTISLPVDSVGGGYINIINKFEMAKGLIL